MKYFLTIVYLLIATSIVAQKRLSQTYDASEVQELYINSNEIFQISVRAIETDQIVVNTIIDGETFASTLLNSKIEDNILKITTGKTPDYEPFNDKLSAHKVMAIELEIVIPLGMDLWVYSTLASLDTKGAFGQVRVDLGRGHFVGEGFRFRESAKINTLSGSITIDVDQVSVRAQSRNGKVVVTSGLTNGLPMHLESLHGDIVVTKSE